MAATAKKNEKKEDFHGITPGSVGGGANDRRRATLAISAAQAEQLEELDTIKIKTMYQMVEDIQISSDGLTLNRKLLFLTNSQARSFNSSNMQNVFEALELPPAHFVIRLMASYGGLEQYKSHAERRGSHRELIVYPPELNIDDINTTESQIMLFVKECILPVALQTRALILVGGCNDDSLAMAVQKVLGPIQNRMGKNCPFTIVGFCFSHEVHFQAHKQNSYAGQYASASKSWSRRFSEIHSTMMDIHENHMERLQQTDMNPACSHFIVFEGLDTVEHKVSREAGFSFKATFVECTVAKLPSVVVQAQRWASVTQLADVARRKIPLILLDSRERWPLLTPEFYGKRVKSGQTKLALGTNALQPPGNFYKQTTEFDRVKCAEDRLRRHLSFLIENGNDGNGCFESWQTSSLAFLRKMSQIRSKKNIHASQNMMSLGEAIKAEMEGGAKNSGFGSSDRNAEENDIAKQLADVFFETVGGLNIDGELKIINNYITSRQKGDSFAESDVKAWGNSNNDEKKPFVNDYYMRKANEALATRTEKKKRIEKDGGRDTTRSTAEWLCVFDLLSSENCFAESIYDLQGVSNIMADVAKIDNLPQKHTLEALLLLRNAWSAVDAYQSSALCYKFISKFTYFCMLLLGSAVVFSGIFYASYGCSEDYTCTLSSNRTEVESFSGAYQRWYDNNYCYSRLHFNTVTIALSLTNSIVAALIAYMNPAARWHHLKTSALYLESEIWGFRTRTGNYRENRISAARSAEKQFQETIKNLENETLQSGDLRRTVFFSKPSSAFNKHNQFLSTGLCCSLLQKLVKKTESINLYGRKAVPLNQVDNHHSPLRPEDYIKFRLLPTMHFYRSRIPKYSRCRAFAKMLMVVGSLAGAILSFLDSSFWVAFISCVTSSVVAWIEFSGTEKKLDRYSNVVSSLKMVKMWWESLPEVEKLATHSIDMLVGTVEGQLATERQGWRASSQSAKKLQDILDSNTTRNASFESSENASGTADFVSGKPKQGASSNV
jgi:hypothetical protein